jgi:hypothetical protein
VQSHNTILDTAKGLRYDISALDMPHYASIFFSTNSSHWRQKEGFTAYYEFKINASIAKIKQMLVTPPVLVVEDLLKLEQGFKSRY